MICEKRWWGTAGRSGEDGAAVRQRGLAAEVAKQAELNRRIDLALQCEQ